VANFVLVDTGMDADLVFARMLRLGVIVRPMSAYNLPSSIRVTVGTHEENVRFLDALETAIREQPEPPPSRPAAR
jgi:histidinol-phosphate aminotransferase